MRKILDSRLFDPFRVELICQPVTPGCTRGYSHSCPSGTVRLPCAFPSRVMENPKSEIRNPKEVRNPKSQKPSLNVLGCSGFGIRISLGIRHTVFGIHP